MKNRLLKLLNDNRRAPLRQFTVSAKSADEAEVFLYDAIVDDDLEAEYWGGVSPQSFVKALRDIDANTIHLRINSPGGSVFAARAIEQALREHKAQVVVHIDGLAASAATFVAMAGDQIIMAPGALFMIHKAWTLAMGNSDDLMETASLLEKIDGTLADTYAKRTGMDPKKCMAMMADETWLTAQEALDSGFIDFIAEDGGDDKKKAAWNLAAYDHAPHIEHQEAAAPAAAPANKSAHCDVPALLRKLEVAALIP